jgi:hypothetical protein
MPNFPLPAAISLVAEIVWGTILGFPPRGSWRSAPVHRQSRLSASTIADRSGGAQGTSASY